MEILKVKVNPRGVTGKQSAKKARRQGSIPAIVYGKDINVPVEVPRESFKILKSIHFSESTILDMEIVNEKKKSAHAAIIKKIQYHPLTEEIIHIDFLKVSLKEKITVHVPLIFKGESKGVKEGGVFEQVLRELEIEGLPMDIPEKIEIDISNLDIGDSLHTSDVGVAGNLKIITQPEETIATVSAKKEEEVVPVEEAAAPEEPEVTKEKKEQEPPAEEGPKKEKGKEKGQEKKK